MASGLDLNISASSIISAIFFGIVGYYLYKRGKKELNYQILMIGIGLMVYPYFTSGPLQDWGVGFGFCGLAYYLYNK